MINIRNNEQNRNNGEDGENGEKENVAENNRTDEDAVMDHFVG